MPTTDPEFGIALDSAEGERLYFSGDVKVNGVTFVPFVVRLSDLPKDAPLEGIWTDPSAVTAARIMQVLTENGTPGLSLSVVEIRRADHG